MHGQFVSSPNGSVQQRGLNDTCPSTLWFNVSISSTVATCKRYFAKSSSSRSAMALGVWASLNADIFSPCLGLRAKLRPWKAPRGWYPLGGRECRSRGHQHVSCSWRCYLKMPDKCSQCCQIDLLITHNWGKWFQMICRGLT